MASIAEALAIAARHYQGGALAQAEAIYRQILAADPKQIEALHGLGVIAQRLGRNDAAVDLIGRAVKLAPRRADAQSDLAVALLALGRFADAVPHLRQSLKLKPGFAEAHNNLGMALWQQGKNAAAASEFRRAVKLKPGHHEALTNLAIALSADNQLDEAVALCRQALALKPDVAEVHLNLGLILQKQNELAAAQTHLERAAALKPDLAEAHLQLGNLLHAQEKLDAAVPHYERALALNPKLAEAHGKLGVAFAAQGHLLQGLPHLRQAALLAPDDAEAHFRVGVVLQELGGTIEATAEIERAVALEPDNAKACSLLGFARQNQGRMTEARALHAKAIARDPGLAGARFGLVIAQLPMLYDDADEIARRRAAYEVELTKLLNLADRDGYRAFLGGVACSLPFYLAYQGMNDRDLQLRYGELVCRILADAYGAATLSPPPGPGEPVRVGFCSGYFCRHSVWKMPLKGWLGQLDRRRFQLFGYHTAAKADAETAVAAGLCHRFVQGPLSIERWREEILADRLHVLIYPEIGMERAVVPLAAQRLAPVQCNSWGHPDTSGFATIDYYLSSALMEPPDGDAHYSERLVRLPNLSIYYEPVAVSRVAFARAAIGLRAAATVYWSGQSIYKYLPQHDPVFPRIAQGAGDCQFIFIEFSGGAEVNAQFRARLGRAFAAAGLNLEDFCVFLPLMDFDRFAAAQGLTDVFLDTIEWSGCNSAMESLAHDLPIVTLKGALMRGRHSAAFLEMMGVTETIAATQDAYVEIAVRLARDVAWRQALKQRIAENKHRLYRDRAAIVALEEFLVRAARGEGLPAGPRAAIF